MARYPKNSSPKLTYALIQEIAAAIKSGMYIESAVALVGISKDTFYRWLREAKKDGASKILKELSYAVTRSIAEDEMRHLAIIDKAAMGEPKLFVHDSEGNVKKDEFNQPIVKEYLIKPNWRASAWRLARRNPRHWGKNSIGIENSLLEEEESCNQTLEVIFIDSEICSPSH